MTKSETIAARIKWLEYEMAGIEAALGKLALPIANAKGMSSALADDRVRAERRTLLHDLETHIATLPDARITLSATPPRLAMLGISVTCTASDPGIYTSWIAKARSIAAEKLEAQG